MPQMKNDMSGAAAILAAMSALRGPGLSDAQVTGYLMCTDNMPGSTAMALGDVHHHPGRHHGRGRQHRCRGAPGDGRCARPGARGWHHDAIVDIATLTGAMMRALGREVAGVIGNDQALVDQVLAAGGQPPARRSGSCRSISGYRGQLDSSIADIKNLGGGDGGAITAALFLAEFMGDMPLAHIDIAGTAQSEGDRGG